MNNDTSTSGRVQRDRAKNAHRSEFHNGSPAHREARAHRRRFTTGHPNKNGGLTFGAFGKLKPGAPLRVKLATGTSSEYREESAAIVAAAEAKAKLSATLAPTPEQLMNDTFASELNDE